VPGDAHSRCLHPAIGEQDANPFAAIFMLLADPDKVSAAALQLHITANPIGVRNGWFLWPANFDPVWLITCEGFEAIPPKSPPTSL